MRTNAKIVQSEQRGTQKAFFLFFLLPITKINAWGYICMHKLLLFLYCILHYINYNNNNYYYMHTFEYKWIYKYIAMCAHTTHTQIHTYIRARIHPSEICPTGRKCTQSNFSTQFFRSINSKIMHFPSISIVIIIIYIQLSMHIHMINSLGYIL